MGNLNILKRNKANRRTKSIVAIGCEGKNKTESIYFKNFSSRECIIKFSTGNSTDPVGMANNLVNFIQQEDIKKEYGDVIYLLIDTDMNITKQKQIDEAKIICNKHGIELITSTPTFEFWYILHFEPTTKIYQNSAQVKNEIKKKIDGYTESMNVFPVLADKVDNAISNAKKIEQYQLKNGQDLNSCDCNPYTRIYKVVEELKIRNSKK